MHTCDAGSTEADGSYTLTTTWLTNCTGGVIDVTVAFNDANELYGVSTAVIQVTVVGTCVSPSDMASFPFKLALRGPSMHLGVFNSKCVYHAAESASCRLSQQHVPERLLGLQSVTAKQHC